MTYGLKLIRFRDRDCYILLQNENGPCPLLAASNGLILQGHVALPMSSISNRMATLDDVTNMLADYAVQKHLLSTTTLASDTSTTTTKVQSSTDTSDQTMVTNIDNQLEPSNDESQQQQQEEEKIELCDEQGKSVSENTVTTNVERDNNNNDESSMFFINELMHYIPKFQYGMDLNPKFTDGICGYEYTAEMTAFDMLQCKLVHGWLINPFTDDDVYTIIGRKSYNELVDILISSKDIVSNMEVQLSSISSEIDTLKQFCNDTTDPIMLQQQHEKIQKLQQKYDSVSKDVNEINTIETFLETTGHQLTAYGLETLYEQIEADEICVFFRNNHYSTIYKNPITQSLYLLVTDMGYADAAGIIWEKLDVIDGDTEYCNDRFETNKQPKITTSTNTSTGMILTEDEDYNLALRLSMEDQQQYRQQQPQQQQQQQSSWASMLPTAVTTSTGGGTPTFSFAGMTNVLNSLGNAIAPMTNPTTTNIPSATMTSGPAPSQLMPNPNSEPQQQATVVAIPNLESSTTSTTSSQQQGIQLQHPTPPLQLHPGTISTDTAADDLPPFSQSQTTNPVMNVSAPTLSNTSAATSSALPISATEAADRMLALQLQEQDDQEQQQRRYNNSTTVTSSQDLYEQESIRLALQLQEEDRMEAARLLAQQQQQAVSNRQQQQQQQQQQQPVVSSQQHQTVTSAATNVISSQNQSMIVQVPPQSPQQQQQQQQRGRRHTINPQQRLGVGNSNNNTNGVAKDSNCSIM